MSDNQSLGSKDAPQDPQDIFIQTYLRENLLEEEFSFASELGKADIVYYYRDKLNAKIVLLRYLDIGSASIEDLLDAMPRNNLIEGYAAIDTKTTSKPLYLVLLHYERFTSTLLITFRFQQRVPMVFVAHNLESALKFLSSRVSDTQTIISKSFQNEVIPKQLIKSKRPKSQTAQLKRFRNNRLNIQSTDGVQILPLESDIPSKHIEIESSSDELIPDSAEHCLYQGTIQPTTASHKISYQPDFDYIIQSESRTNLSDTYSIQKGKILENICEIKQDSTSNIEEITHKIDHISKSTVLPIMPQTSFTNQPIDKTLIFKDIPTTHQNLDKLEEDYNPNIDVRCVNPLSHEKVSNDVCHGQVSNKDINCLNQIIEKRNRLFELLISFMTADARSLKG